ncbi:MAG: DUF1844 domain-containing protein [Bdellovibrionales bacterium]|nr:DUF1844 domain-containing protein [Bdellovibrionales bacterium]
MNSENTTPQENKLEASFSTLILSIASSAAMSLGLAPNPTTNKTEKNMEMARFNIDLLVVLQAKTKNNLDKEEGAFLESVIRDLQLKFIQHQ